MRAIVAPVLRRTLLVWASALAIAGCARTRAAPTPESPKPPPPDLTGRAVFVLPAQPAPGARRDPQSGEIVPGLDGEIAYWLEDHGPRVDWTFPPEVRRALERNAMLNIDVDALAVGSFHRAEVINIGDPLLGDLRRLAAVVDARLALVPVAATYVPGTPDGRVEVAVALIDTFGGRVLWYGVMAGEPGAADSRDVAASAARAVARALLP
jgi:hypothetical protein